MDSKILWLILAVVIVGLALAWKYKATPDDFTLAAVHQSIELRFPEVSHVSTEQLKPMLENNPQLLVFDVREPAEFEVSHLQGATRLAPDTSSAEFMRQYGNTLTDKTVVFYCSVGQRSSKLASELGQVLAESGAQNWYNLEGGVFAWRNALMELTDEQQRVTDKVHPYNQFWGTLVLDEGAISYE